MTRSVSRRSSSDLSEWYWPIVIVRSYRIIFIKQSGLRVIEAAIMPSKTLVVSQVQHGVGKEVP